MKQNERIYYMDNIKAFLIFLVVIGHVIDLSAYPSDFTRFIYFAIYYFHMPMFIFIMGYFSKNTEKCRDEAFQRYLIPYLVMVILSFLFGKLTGTIDEQSRGLFRIFSPMVGCWFLWATYVWKVLIHDLKKIKGILVLSLAAGLLVGFSHEFGYKFSLSRIVVFLFFFMWGYAMKQEQLDKLRKIPKVIPMIGILISVIVIYYLSVVKYIPVESVLGRLYYRDTNSWEDCIYRMAYYLIASILILACLCLARNKNNKFTVIGESTFYIYFFHLYFVKLIEKYCSNVTLFQENYWCYFGFVLITSIVITYLLSRKFVKELYNKGMGLLWQILTISSLDKEK